MSEVAAWLEGRRAATHMRVTRVPLAAMDGWRWAGTPVRLEHQSGKFFTVDGIRVTTDTGPVPEWDQPILVQPELGILGIVTREFNGVRHFLMQAKIEPGNINGVQLSPTVQATRSNYTRVHAGSAPRYLEYFLDPSRGQMLVNQLQTEQASRYYRKQNRNLIVEISDDVELADNFCWLTLAQIKQLLRAPNLVNMDTRTVLACLPLRPQEGAASATRPTPIAVRDLPLADFALALLESARLDARPLHTMRDLQHWLTQLRSTHFLDVERRPLNALTNWTVDEMSIHHNSAPYFSVIGVSVETGAREVQRWQQPLLAHDGYGLNGFLLQRINGVLHFLVRACAYPGNRELFELGSTVSRSNANAHSGRGYPPFLDMFLDPPAEWVRYSAIQSEEGGRFFQFQNRYVILEVPEGQPIEPSPVHHWMTLAQIEELLPHGYFNIEGRNLLACLDLCDQTETLAFS